VRGARSDFDNATPPPPTTTTAPTYLPDVGLPRPTRESLKISTMNLLRRDMVSFILF
jgi:hypothetical protein